MAGKRIDAIAYLRTSSAANVGADKDSDKRQRGAIAAFAKAHGYRLIDEFYDAAVSGADAVDSNSRTHGAMGSAYASKTDYRVQVLRTRVLECRVPDGWAGRADRWLS
jgi:hypothetical protein